MKLGGRRIATPCWTVEDSSWDPGAAAALRERCLGGAGWWPSQQLQLLID
jgi:hypothetical protein